MSENVEQTPIQKMLGDFAPTFVSLTDDVLFGQVWSRPELSPRSGPRPRPSSAAHASRPRAPTSGADTTPAPVSPRALTNDRRESDMANPP